MVYVIGMDCQARLLVAACDTVAQGGGAGGLPQCSAVAVRRRSVVVNGMRDRNGLPPPSAIGMEASLSFPLEEARTLLSCCDAQPSKPRSVEAARWNGQGVKHSEHSTAQVHRQEHVYFLSEKKLTAPHRTAPHHCVKWARGYHLRP